MMQGQKIMGEDLANVMHELGPEFAARARYGDEQDLFVGENVAALKECGILRAAIPAELGGGGAEHRDLAEMLRVLARYCGSTALALSMHTHQVVSLVWRWRRDPGPVEMLLRDVAAKNLVLVTSGGSDWIGLKRNEGYTIAGINQTPLLPGILVAIAFLMALGSAWWREGR